MTFYAIKRNDEMLIDKGGRPTKSLKQVRLFDTPEQAESIIGDSTKMYIDPNKTYSYTIVPVTITIG